MKKTKSILIIAFFLIFGVSFAQTQANLDCSILKDIILKYTKNADTTAYVVIQNKKHTEILQGGKYYIKSDLDWVSDCEYNATITDLTLPNFPFKEGEVMNVKFEEITNGYVTGTASVRGQKLPIAFKIMD